MVSSDETSLVEGCLQGDTTSMRELIDRFQNDVFGLCVRLLNHRQDAEDVTQEVFLRVFRSLHRWDSTRPLKPWIVGITVNRCRTWISQRGRKPDLVDYLHDTPGKEQADDSRELVQEIELAMGELRDEYRIVFVLFHQENRSYEEIAEVMERPVGTIKTWLHRARTEVMEQLKRRGMISEEESISS